MTIVAPLGHSSCEQVVFRITWYLKSLEVFWNEHKTPNPWVMQNTCPFPYCKFQTKSDIKSQVQNNFNLGSQWRIRFMVLCSLERIKITDSWMSAFLSFYHKSYILKIPHDWLACREGCRAPELSKRGSISNWATWCLEIKTKLPNLFHSKVLWKAKREGGQSLDCLRDLLHISLMFRSPLI